MSAERIGNRVARRIFLDRHALAEPPAGAALGVDLLALIRRLGFVQVDSINTVERAHHTILWSRRQSFRPRALRLLHERDRVVFEHWTHDASIIPIEFLPHWRLRFAAMPSVCAAATGIGRGRNSKRCWRTWCAMWRTTARSQAATSASGRSHGAAAGGSGIRRRPPSSTSGGPGALP